MVERYATTSASSLIGSLAALAAGYVSWVPFTRAHGVNTSKPGRGKLPCSGLADPAPSLIPYEDGAAFEGQSPATSYAGLMLMGESGTRVLADRAAA